MHFKIRFDFKESLQAQFISRDLYEKGIRAFVSSIQAYQKHECSLIFQFKGKVTILAVHILCL